MLCTVATPLNYVIILVTSATLSLPSFIPNARNSLPPLIQYGQELIIKHVEATLSFRYTDLEHKFND